MKSVVMFCAFMPVMAILGVSWLCAIGSLYLKEEVLCKLQPAQG